MIIGFPHKPGSGGPGSFQKRFESSLFEKEYGICYSGDNCKPDLILVVGGTKKIFWLWSMKRKGVPIIYRLDGISWLHRKNKFNLKNYMLAESRNLLNQIVRYFFADYIVYQSEFSKKWWEKKGWKCNTKNSIISNGVDLKEFVPEYNKESALSIICIEGVIDYSPYAISLLNYLQNHYKENLQIILYGNFYLESNKNSLSKSIDYRGFIDMKELPSIYRNGIFLSLDILPACPNTVIEALSSGIPVVGFDTGALPELVPQEAGIVVPYGSDPWKLGFPDVDGLIKAINKILYNWDSYSRGARIIAEKQHGIKNIFSQYIELIYRLINYHKLQE